MRTRGLVVIPFASIVFTLALILCAIAPTPGWADGARDNVADTVRPIPPVGKPLSAADLDMLQTWLKEFGRGIDDVRAHEKENPTAAAYLPDVQIYFNALSYPLLHHETINPVLLRKAVADGTERLAQLSLGRHPWTDKTGPRGYVSRIDGSVQPYIVTVPTDYSSPESLKESPSPRRYRLDVWGHGRDELLTELRFVEMDAYLPELRHLKQSMEPRGKFILSLYGRYLNASKFAGEIDGLEAMQAVEHAYPIDPDRRFIFGFSMGGATAWQYAVHYPDLWAAAAPGAGFAETPEFLTLLQKEDVSQAPWYEQTLWHQYNSTDYVANLTHLPTICYAGDKDAQKQASDAMLKAAEAEHVHIDRIIGTNIGHGFTLQAKEELDRRIDDIVARGRDPFPAAMRFTTWTLRYNHCDWLTIDGLEHHWQRARVEGRRDGASFSLKTENVTGITIDCPATVSTLAPNAAVSLTLDGQNLEAGKLAADKSISLHLMREAGRWKVNAAPSPANGPLHKTHGLQGPIDDAFMEPFLIVRPTGKPMNQRVGAWEAAECDHAVDQWFKQFRGVPRIKNDIDVNDADIAAYNLVCFGDRSSNALLARLIDRLPIRWTAQQIQLGGRTFSSDHCAPVLIYPNPLQPAHYLVLNSGFTYREYDYLNNARQTPKLPDYAVIDVDQPTTARHAGGVVAAGFFDESWAIQPDDGKPSHTP